MTVETTGDLKKTLEYTAMREIESLTIEKAYDAVKLYNNYHNVHMDPE